MTVDIIRPGYDAAKDDAWHLSCWLAPDLHAWCVHDRSSGLLMALAALRGAHLPQERLLPPRPASVSFTALPEISTLVPESALAPGTEMRYLKMVHGTVPTGLLREEPIATLGAHCIYLHDEAAELALLDRYPHARSLPLQGTLVSHALARSATGPVLLAHRSATRLDLVAADGGKLLLSNTFHATVAEDVLYYALLATEQCGLSPATVQLRAGGTHLSAGEEHLLSTYFTHGPVPSTGSDEPALKGLRVPNAHHWTGLIDQFTCAS